MNSLEKYLIDDCHDGYVLINDIDYSYFNYENFDELEFDLEFLIDLIFNNYKIIYDKDASKYLRESRLSQSEFKLSLIKKYGQCVVTGSKSSKQLEAAHIIPYKDDKHNFVVSNGLLLTSNIHKTFDAYLWSINPESFTIETNNNISKDELGDIFEYKGKILNFDKGDSILIKNLTNHYKSFINSIN